MTRLGLLFLAACTKTEPAATGPLFSDPDDFAFADDGLAYSVDGQSVDAVRWFPDGRGTGGVWLFTTLGGTQLWAASLLDGVPSPAVPLTAERQDANASVDLGTAAALFLYGTPGREGDALVLFRRRTTGSPADGDGDGAREDDANVGLFSLYLDRSNAGRETARADDGTDLSWGLTPLATRVDADPGGDGPHLDGDVVSAGFVSDGTVASGLFDAGQSSQVSGDDLTFVHALWVQPDVRPDPLGPVPTGRRLWSAPFRLGEATTRFAPADARVADTSSTVLLDDGDSVSDRVLTHDGIAVWTLSTSAGDPSSNDVFLQGTVFGTAGAGAAQALSRADDDPGRQVVPGAPPAAQLYGPDHGLDGYLLFFEEQGYGPDGLSTDRDVVATSLAADGSQPRRRELDAFFLNAVGDEAGVAPGSLFTRLLPEGTLVAGWIQPHATPAQVAAAPPSVATPSAWVVPIRDADLDQGVGRVTRVTTDVVDTAGELDRTVSRFVPQAGLGHGATLPEHAWQTDSNRLHILLVQEHSDSDPTGLDPDAWEDPRRLLATWIDLYEGQLLDGASPPAELEVDRVDRDWDPARTLFADAVGWDDGLGGLVVAWRGQANHRDDDHQDLPDDDALGAFAETRLFVGRPGEARVQVSSVPDPWQGPQDRAVTDWALVPAGEPSAPTHHLLAREWRTNAGPRHLTHRVLDPRAEGPIEGALAPAPEEPPTSLFEPDLPLDLGGWRATVDGGLLALVVEQEGQLLYDEHDGSWGADGGEPLPLTPGDGVDVRGWGLFSDPAGGLSGMGVWWLAPDPDEGDVRLHLRVHR